MHLVTESAIHIAQKTQVDDKFEDEVKESGNLEERRKGCWYHATTSHDILECRLFLDMTP